MGGPGAGKTHVSLVKARNEIRAGALAEGQRVLFLSFARSTVARIAEKAVQLVGRQELQQLEINTYHSFAWSILRSHAYLLNGRTRVRLLPPPEAAAHLADFATERRDEEKERLFYEEGRLHFDLFARLSARLLSCSKALTRIYSQAYPLIILDEFQDTDADQWALMRLLGQQSRLIALGDPEQRIYEFRGADPARLSEFATEFRADTFDFVGENHRSSGTDITTFGNDLLTDAHKGKRYSDVRIFPYGYYFGRSPHYQLKTRVLAAVRRLIGAADFSVAILVPSRALMIGVSDYLSTASDGLPELDHDVAMDAEPPALAAVVIAATLEGGREQEVNDRLLGALMSHIRGRGGRDGTPRADLELAAALNAFRSTGKIRGVRRKELIDECQRIAGECCRKTFTGSAVDDWLAVRSLFAQSRATALQRIAEDARYLRLLHRGSAFRNSLSAIWKEFGHYSGAERAVKDALLQEHFAASQSKTKGLHVMTIHKSKGKEFDEVFVYEGRHHSRLMKRPEDPNAVAQDRLVLRVAVTRAIHRATILTPADSISPFLT
ncbi:DNA helicase UvrD [Caballeronia megalochromosomata]|nr:DNA helicase UvrD [Caballeronia megalochromosomata]